MDAEKGEEEDEKDSRKDACQKELVNSDLRDNGVDDQGKAGREEKTQRSRGGQQSEGKRSGYFPLIMAGKRIPPMAMIVKPVAPVKAVKAAQVMRAMIDNPPGSQPRKASVSRISLLGAPPSERR